MKLLIVEDEKEISTFVKKSMESLFCHIDVAHDGVYGVELAAKNDYDVLILDQNLPGKSGADICQSLRHMGKNMPVIMLTADSDIAKKVHALTIGANDYVTKPFAIEELIARVNVLLRTTVKKSSAHILKYKDITLDQNTCSATRGDRQIDLCKKEAALLACFMNNPQAVLTQDMLLQKVWDMNMDRNINTLTVHIRKLRKKINAPDEEKMITTVRGVGYHL